MARNNRDLYIYPILSLHAFLRAFGTIIKAHIAPNTIKIGKFGPKFRIISDGVYAKVVYAIQELVEVGLEKKIKHTPTPKQMMFVQAKCD